MVYSFDLCSPTAFWLVSSLFVDSDYLPYISETTIFRFFVDLWLIGFFYCETGAPIFSLMLNSRLVEGEFGKLRFCLFGDKQIDGEKDLFHYF